MIDTINFKPALEFDKIYGTKISKTDWKFPDGYSADELHEKFFVKKFNKEERAEFRSYLKKLNESYFPLLNVEKMRISVKTNILEGMVSGFNYHDIVFFISDNRINSRELLLQSINRSVDVWDIQWIISPETISLINQHFNNTLHS